MDEDRLQQLERRLDDLDRRESATERALDRAMKGSREAMSHIMPTETRQHMRNAGREWLLAFRTMIDHWADRLDDKSGSKPRSGSEREKIQID
jgi:hypothetical protein